MAQNTINIEFNQYIVVVATIVAAVAAGYLSYATGVANPLVAAATAGAIGFAVSYLRARYGAAVIIVGALVFFFTFTQAPPRLPATAPERHSTPPAAYQPPTLAPVIVDQAPQVAPVEVPRTAVIDTVGVLPLPELVRIPAGSFLMGCQLGEQGCRDNEKPAHWVQVAAFELGKSEVTRAQFSAFTKAAGYRTDAERRTGIRAGCWIWDGDKPAGLWRAGKDWRDPGMQQGGNDPVVCISWNDAQAYVDWLHQQTGQGWRLPTEAEWEYAARAGTTTAFSTGNCITTSQANYNGNYDYAGCGAKTGVSVGKTRAVGSYPANPWGLYDLYGNVWEWMQDCYHDSYTGAPQNGSGWLDFCGKGWPERVFRGGSWHQDPQYLRSAYRVGFGTGDQDNSTGFRVARTLTP